MLTAISCMHARTRARTAMPEAASQSLMLGRRDDGAGRVSGLRNGGRAYLEGAVRMAVTGGSA